MEIGFVIGELGDWGIKELMKVGIMECWGDGSRDLGIEELRDWGIWGREPKVSQLTDQGWRGHA